MEKSKAWLRGAGSTQDPGHTARTRLTLRFSLLGFVLPAASGSAPGLRRLSGAQVSLHFLGQVSAAHGPPSRGGRRVRSAPGDGSPSPGDCCSLSEQVQQGKRDCVHGHGLAPEYQHFLSLGWGGIIFFCKVFKFPCNLGLNPSFG